MWLFQPFIFYFLPTGPARFELATFWFLPDRTAPNPGDDPFVGDPTKASTENVPLGLRLLRNPHPIIQRDFSVNAFAETSAKGLPRRRFPFSVNAFAETSAKGLPLCLPKPDALSIAPRARSILKVVR